jgi:hypothetical protein
MKTLKQLICEAGEFTIESAQDEWSYIGNCSAIDVGEYQEDSTMFYESEGRTYYALCA